MTEWQVTISGFHQDEEGHWVEELSCGHNRHMRHQPPWQNRPWVMMSEGRQSMIGESLRCRRCQIEISENANI